MHHFLTLCIIHSIGLDYSGFRNYNKLDCKYAFRKASFNALFLRVYAIPFARSPAFLIFLHCWEMQPQ